MKDSRLASWRLAEAARQRVTGKLIAITGTVGKSTTRRMLRHVLSKDRSVTATPGNWNTPEAIATLVASSIVAPERVLVEVGISALDSNLPVADLLRADVTVITSIGVSQANEYPSVDDTFRVKTRLLECMNPVGTAVVNVATSCADSLVEKAHAHAGEVITIGEDYRSDIELQNAWVNASDQAFADVLVAGESLRIPVPAPGRGMAFNAMATLAVLIACRDDWRDLYPTLGSAKMGKRLLERHRVQLLDGEALLIDDSHNATVLSMKAAFEVLRQEGVKHRRRIAVLGEMVNLGDESNGLHRQLALPLLAVEPDRVYTTGEGMKAIRRELPSLMLGPHAATPEELAALVLKDLQPGDVVLVKGSHRNTGFRRVAPAILRGADANR